MEDRGKHSDGSGELILFLVAAGVVAYALIYVVTMLAVILTICITAAAGYLGVRLALDSTLWQGRRIERDNQLEAARCQELAHFQAQGNDWMLPILNNHYDDKKRDLYRDRNRLDEAARSARRIKDLLK